MIAPQGKGDRVTDLLSKGSDSLGPNSYRVESTHTGKAHLQRRAAELVPAAGSILLY